MTFVRALLGLLLTAAWGPARLGAQAAPLPLSRVTGPITIDGNLDDPAWRAIAPLPLTTYAPVFRAQPTQRTEIRVGYDDDYFYAAGWFYDTDPSGIRINSLYRDRWNGDDAFAIYLDPFNDNQNSKWFGTTPGGIRFDQLVSDDGATLNESWDTFWTSKTVVTDEGWFAEVRIPLSSIGFRASDDGTVVMGLTVTRLVSRLGERVTFPEIDPKFEFRRPSLARDVMLSGLRTRTPLYVTPYVLGGATRKAVAVSPGFRFDDATEREAGLDIRYPISSQLTLDLTANTDFAQVEADDQQVNLDRFPLFYPERRRLFQEGSGIF
ncbi:MAG: carbohydrate binding family 9 domain-containing protein, partial [Gemmatimonadetes bacterium]|nr:carbohydrate binding family 9 domain-containing protein [Gemmatimonadota bacterium]